MAKPRELAFGEISAARLHALNRIVQRDFAAQKIEYFLITQGLAGLATQRLGERPQGSNFVHEPYCEHVENTLVDAVIEFIAPYVEPKAAVAYRVRGLSCGRRRPLALPGADRASGGLVPQTRTYAEIVG